jgi:uncharacterized protein with FMN-binding domain
MVTGMRRITLWFLSTAAVVALLFGYHTSTSGAVPAASETVVAGPAAPGSSASGTPTVTGSVASTRWGDVQVTITVTDGRITAVDVPEYPTANGKDQQINAYALPVLEQETLSAQSADIDMVSGATVTSHGYVESLQSALDQAGL